MKFNTLITNTHPLSKKEEEKEEEYIPGLL
jgi:hypothetical protein